ncbi:hypothetical protein MMC07_001581 [Pseudocyphellaria aurata]|nr:hypothetical protein [Pseudocyphellaria aurata]
MSTPRSSPDIQLLRQKTAYVNFSSPLTPTFVAHSSHASSSTNPTFQRKAWTKIEEGFGSRHLHDTAPFSLWDQDEYDFRGPTSNETAWISRSYNATAIDLFWPMIIIETETPPSPLPVTVGCVAALFVPPPDPSVGDREAYRPSPIQVNTNFASPRVADPIHAYELEAWKIPTYNQQEDILRALHTCMNLKAVNFVWPYIVVELHVDERVYTKHSLPGRVAGCTTVYHRSEIAFWQDMEPRPRDRLINPNSSVQDTTNYLEKSSCDLTPGVRVESAPFTDEGPYATESCTSTAGVILRNSDGQVKLTVANHGFRQSNAVFHPTTNDCRIGEITERWPAQDIALVQLDPSIRFNNSHYFEAQKPMRLLRSSDLRQSKTGKWFSVDGMSTGLLYLFLRGVRLCEARRPTSPRPIDLEHSSWLQETVFRSVGPMGGGTKDGVCGAPIVEDDEMGGVAGFFQLAGNEICLSPVLDELIDRGWALL